MDNKDIINALAPDTKSQIAYAGRIKQTELVTVYTEDGTPIEKEVTFYLSWDSISELLTLVRKRAGLQP